ncbi:nuclear transport factor 2 family protein [Chloroflexota bacterium]
MSDDLEKRVKTLEDERGIISTLYDYGHAIDYGDKEGWLDLFTEDAVYHVTQRGNTMPHIGVPQPPGGLKGHAALKEYILIHPNAPDAWHKHIVDQPIIKFESDTEASVASYFFRLDEIRQATASVLEGQAYVLVFGRYKDKMVKGADGKWRFKERLIEIENGMPMPR